MIVELIDFTRNAAEVLIATKNTRLTCDSSQIDKAYCLSESEKMKQLEYISNTIKSSWEFIDFTFSIQGVTRAFTHQFVRNRQGSYAQQTMRTLDVAGFEYGTGPSFEKNTQAAELYHDTMATINAAYQELLEMGTPPEDARGILPTNIHTNIVAKYNLRTLSELMASRASTRTQDEFRRVLEAMHAHVILEYPWMDMFLKGQKYKAAEQVQGYLLDVYEGTSKEVDAMKQLDVLRK